MAKEPEGKNRLAQASSPYLLLHQENPVDWYPWGVEALERARREDKPIFVSVGYSTCHWCHVMERESFSDPAIAALMNESFVNVKIDREERPDLDEIYMAATQILSHQGGWPNSVFLTPELVPYFAGTYFPPEDRMGRPGFATVLRSMAAAWKERRSDVEEQAESVATAMRRYLEERDRPADEPVGPELARGALAGLEETFDEVWGGFGGAPKFPTPANLLLLLEEAPARPNLERLLSTTLDQMGRGGIYDQLAGGFHRYATDREWKIPHFEKMLYDNGLLLEVYARRYGISRDSEDARIARETAGFLAREMTSPEGAFWSAIDADSEHREGAYYVWTRDELLDVLSDEDFGFLAPLYGFDGPPFFEGDSWILHLPRPWRAQAKRRQLSVDELLGQVAPLKARLLAARGERTRPGTDDKILADWNGTAITGLAVAGRLLEDPEMTSRAAAAADFVVDRMRGRDGQLFHSWRRGKAGVPAFLSDYVFLVRGLLELHLATGAERWLALAVALTEEQEQRLGDPSGGFFVAGKSPDVLFRSREVFDGAVPGANGVACLNLLELAERTGEERWLVVARDLLRSFAPVARRVPQASRTLAVAALRHHRLTLGGEALPVEDGERSLDAPFGEATGEEPLVAAELDLGPGGETGRQPFRLLLRIAQGWHVQATLAAGADSPSPVTGTTGISGRGLAIADLKPSPPTRFIEEAGVWEGEVEIEGTLRVLEEGASLLISYQACDDQRCLAPTRLEIGPISPPG